MSGMLLLPVCSWSWVPYSWFLLLCSCSFHRDSHCHHALEVLLFVFRFLQRMEERTSFEAGSNKAVSFLFPSGGFMVHCSRDGKVAIAFGQLSSAM